METEMFAFIFFKFYIKNFMIVFVKFFLLLLLQEVASVVSDSVRPQRRQPTRLPRSWGSSWEMPKFPDTALFLCSFLERETS